MKERVNLFDICLYIILFLICIIMLYPVLLTLFKSISSSSAIMAGRVTLYPVEINISAYKLVFKERLLVRSYLNTIYYSLFYTVMTLSLTTIAGYTLSIREFSYRNIITVLFVIPMYFGGGLIPGFILIKNLGMMNSIWAITLPGALGGYSIFIFRTFFQSIPSSLRESAIIDGAGEGRVLLRIIIPLSKALYATFGLFAIVGMWNSFMGPLIFLSSPDKMPIQILLRRLLIEDDMAMLRSEAFKQMQQATGSKERVIPEAMKAAAIMLTITPIMMVYPFLQKYFVKGYMIGAIKG